MPELGVEEGVDYNLTEEDKTKVVEVEGNLIVGVGIDFDFEIQVRVMLGFAGPSAPVREEGKGNDSLERLEDLQCLVGSLLGIVRRRVVVS